MTLRFVLAVVLAAAVCRAGAAELASPVSAGAQPPPPWRVAEFPLRAKPVPRFTVAELDGHRVLRVESDRAYGNLVHPLLDTRAGLLSWRWRVDQPVTGADLRRKSGDDSALKVCAMFDMPLSRVPFAERQLLRLVSARAGEALPTATLCYVWDSNLPAGTLLHNAFTHRVRSIVLGGVPGRWSDERHDLASDFRRAFGDESETVPLLTAIAIGADTDNTGSHSLAFLEGLRLHNTP